MAICRDLEKKYNLHTPIKKDQRPDEIPTKKIDYRKGDIKHQVFNITKSIMGNYHFQSFGEYRTLLEMFNVTAEEIKGERNNKPYNGLTYSVIDDKGDKVGVPFKSSLFGKTVGFDTLQMHYEISKVAVEKKKIRENIRPAISQAIKQCSGMDNFKLLLREKNIGAIFINYENKVILNGSRLGKEFSANIFNNLFKDSPVRNIELTEFNNFPSINQSHNLSEHSSIQQDIGSDILSPLAFEKHGTDYEAEAFAHEEENEEKMRQRKKRRGRGM